MTDKENKKKVIKIDNLKNHLQKKAKKELDWNSEESIRKFTKSLKKDIGNLEKSE